MTVMCAISASTYEVESNATVLEKMFVVPSTDSCVADMVSPAVTLRILLADDDEEPKPLVNVKVSLNTPVPVPVSGREIVIPVPSVVEVIGTSIEVAESESVTVICAVSDILKSVAL